MSVDTPTLGWIGTGRMGHAMVRRLLDAEHSVSVWNRTRAKAEDLVAHGAHVVDSIAELAGTDIVFTIVAADPHLLEVMLGEGGLLRQDSVPRIIVDSSTVSSATSERIRLAAAERGATFLAAPVSGNAKVVKAGVLSVAVSGSREAFDTVVPLLNTIGRSVTYVGEGEVARLVKLAHNIFLGVVTQSLAEVVVLAEKGGVPRHALMAFMNGSVLGSVFTRYKTPTFVNLDMAPTFTTFLLRKDFDLGLAAARQLEVPLPIAAATQQQVQAAVGRGHGDEDFAALLIEQGRNSGVELQPEEVEVGDGLSSPLGAPASGRVSEGSDPPHGAQR
jgi:3-hydroxyisobutyrate dehydrogenase-like beta-hydroxyacid dehydrogenase